MFTTPVQHTPLKNIHELLNFSYDTEGHAPNLPYAYFCENNNYFFSNGNGNVYITPYRKEIRKILKEAGYTEKVFNIEDGQHISSIEKSSKYKWLQKIANNENWYATFEEAFEESKKKDISSISSIHTEDLSVTYISDKILLEGSYIFPLASLWLENNTKNNICTYININDNYVVICDEYGRTYLVSFSNYSGITHINKINNFINRLIAAGYKHTPNPDLYIIKIN